jgi:hypothetical protein
MEMHAFTINCVSLKQLVKVCAILYGQGIDFEANAQTLVINLDVF